MTPLRRPTISPLMMVIVTLPRPDEQRTQRSEMPTANAASVIDREKERRGEGGGDGAQLCAQITEPRTNAADNDHRMRPKEREIGRLWVEIGATHNTNGMDNYVTRLPITGTLARSFLLRHLRATTTSE